MKIRKHLRGDKKSKHCIIIVISSKSEIRTNSRGDKSGPRKGQIGSDSNVGLGWWKQIWQLAFCLVKR